MILGKSTFYYLQNEIWISRRSPRKAKFLGLQHSKLKKTSSEKPMLKFNVRALANESVFFSVVSIITCSKKVASASQKSFTIYIVATQTIKRNCFFNNVLGLKLVFLVLWISQLSHSELTLVYCLIKHWHLCSFVLDW